MRWMGGVHRMQHARTDDSQQVLTKSTEHLADEIPYQLI